MTRGRAAAEAQLSERAERVRDGGGATIVSRHLGLDFAAPFAIGDPLPGSSRADVHVSVEPPRPVPEHLPGKEVAGLTVGGRQLYAVYSAGGGYVFRFHGLCEFHVSAGADAVRCLPGPTSDDGLLHVFLAGAVSALLLALRGRAVLHASAVRLGKGAVLFTGPSGWGKTTVAALCCAAGAQFLSDDVAALEPLRGGVACVGVGSELRLREQAAGIADLFPPPPLARRHTADGRLAVKPPRPAEERNMVTAVVLPRPARGAEHVAVRQLLPAEAVGALLANARIPGLAAPELQRAHFLAAAGLAAGAPVLEANVPWDQPFSTAVATELLTLVEDAIRERAGAGTTT